MKCAGTDSLMQHAYQATALKCREDLAKVELDLRPLRKDTMQLLAADWRYQRKSALLAGFLELIFHEFLMKFMKFNVFFSL